MLRSNAASRADSSEMLMRVRSVMGVSASRVEAIIGHQSYHKGPLRGQRPQAARAAAAPKRPGAARPLHDIRKRHAHPESGAREFRPGALTEPTQVLEQN